MYNTLRFIIEYNSLGCCFLTLTLQKMHGTAWDLVNRYVSETLPTWNVASKKNAQGANIVILICSSKKS